MRGDSPLPRIKRYGSKGLLLLLVLLPVSILVSSGSRRIEALERQHVEDTLQAVVSTTAAALLMWSRDLKNAVGVTASQQEVERAAQAQLAAHRAGSPLHTPALHELQRLLEHRAREYGQVDIGIVAPDGTLIASRFDSLLGQRELVEQDPKTISAALAGEVVLGLPFRSSAAPPSAKPGEPTMICAAPVHDTTGAVIAALVVRLDPARNFTDVVQLGRVGKTGETYAFGPSGHLLTNSRFDEHLRRIGLVPPDRHGLLNIEIRDPGVDLTRKARAAAARSAQPLTKMAKSAIEGRSGVDVDGYRDYRGVPVVGAWHWLNDLDVGIATEMDRDEAYGPIRAVRALNLGMLGVLVVVAVSVTGLLSWRARRLAAAVASENAAVKMRDELLAIVSHDLRTPLSSILLSAGLIERTTGAEGALERVQDLARSIDNAAQRMARLIDDLVTRTRIESGQLHLQRSPQEPETLISKTVDVLSPVASAKQVEIETKVGAGLPAVSADPDRLFEVLSNLAGNAIKLAPEHGKVTLGAELVDGEIDFSVSDNGPGIAREKLSHVFERYWRGESSEGVGLGLYIAKQIVERHGGRIWAESRAGEGATFHFRLAVASPA